MSEYKIISPGEVFVGRVALVSGVAQGMGSAVAREMAVAGHSVVLADIQAAATKGCASELRTMGHEARAHVVDTADEASVADLRDWATHAAGPVSVLVNNAAVSGLRDGAVPALHDTSRAAWGRIIRDNLAGVFLTPKAISSPMMARGWGRIINISSAAVRAFIPFVRDSYAAAKAGVIAPARNLVHEFGLHGIAVNGIASDGMERPVGASLNRENYTYANIPLGRSGQPATSARRLSVWPLKGRIISLVPRSISMEDCTWMSRRPFWGVF